MSILDRFKPKAKEQDSSKAPNTALRAQLLIAELVKDLDTPNQNIVNDLITLITALSSNPDPNIDMTQVLRTAEVLIHQLVESTDNPNQALIDELLQLITLSGQPGDHQKSALTKPAPKKVEPQVKSPTAQGSPEQEKKPQESAAPEPKQNTKTDVQMAAAQAMQEQAQKAANPTPKPSAPKPAAAQPAAAPQAAPAPAPSRGPQVDNHMLSLIMEQTKEVVKVTNTLSKKLTDLEERMQGRLNAHDQAVNSLQIKTEGHDQSFEDIQKAMDKFIGLYEIISNQFNPFVKEEDPKQDGAPQTPAQPATPPPAASPGPAAPPPQQATPPPAPAPPAAPQPAAAPQAAPAPTQPEAPKETPVEQTISVQPDAPKDEHIENLPENLNEFVAFLKKTSDSEYQTLVAGDTNLVSRWAKTHLSNDALAEKLLQTPDKAGVVKLFMKEMLKAKVAAQRAKQGQ